MVKITINKPRLEVKNPALITSNTEKKQHREIVITRINPATGSTTKLSEVLDFLPAGFVYKDETGMGATTLELISKRNSIIVEPIKITASSKAHSNPTKTLYVGSSTKYHPEKFVSRDHIIKYINNKRIKYKKILVVADSLEKVVEAIGPDDLINYFLLIDEIDSFQLDSTFRNKMEDCISIYMKFPPWNRAMLSATRIDFSDPQIKEPVTYFKYDVPLPRKIKIYSTPPEYRLLDVATGMVYDRLRSSPDDKIFVAFNSVHGCYNIAETLVKKDFISSDEIGIYCSVASKNKVGHYFKELNSDRLNCRLSFFTSAYFTGFDINDPYHLISVSGVGNEIHSLSDRRLKQIAGRCRVGLLSETIIHDYGADDKLNYTSKDLIQIAQTQLEAYNCILKHFSKHEELSQIQIPFIQKMSSVLEVFGLKFTKQKNDQEPQSISFLNIDSYLENKRVQRQLYRHRDDLKKALEKDNTVERIHHPVLLSVEQVNVNQMDRDAQVRSIVEKIRDAHTKNEMESLKDSENLTHLQVTIVNDFIKFSKQLEPNDLLDKMFNSLNEQRDLRNYNRLMFSADFFCTSETLNFKQRFEYHFQLNSVHTKKEILDKLNLYFVETGFTNKLESETQAVRFLYSICHCKRNHNSKEGKHKIINYNPFNFTFNKITLEMQKLSAINERKLKD